MESQDLSESAGLSETSRILLGPESAEKEAIFARMRANYQALSPEDKVKWDKTFHELQEQAKKTDADVEKLQKEIAVNQQRAKEFLDKQISRKVRMWSTTGAHWEARESLNNLREISRENNVLCIISTQRSWIFSKDYEIKLMGKRRDVEAVATWWNKHI